MPKKRGVFVTFEGTEGAGKSTLIQSVGKTLQAQGVLVTLTREPGGNSLAEKIRGLILSDEMDPWTELFLYQAARAEHLARTVLPALQRGEWVLCDRFTDSTLAYQAHARGLPWNLVKASNRMATNGLKPHLTVLLDIDPAVGLSRARDPNRFEEEGVAFQKKVRQGFLKSMKEDPQRWLRLPVGKRTPDELALDLMKQFRKRFKLKS